MSISSFRKEILSLLSDATKFGHSSLVCLDKQYSELSLEQAMTRSVLVVLIINLLPANTKYILYKGMVSFFYLAICSKFDAVVFSPAQDHHN